MPIIIDLVQLGLGWVWGDTEGGDLGKHRAGVWSWRGALSKWREKLRRGEAKENIQGQ